MSLSVSALPLMVITLSFHGPKTAQPDPWLANRFDRAVLLQNEVDGDGAVKVHPIDGRTARRVSNAGWILGRQTSQIFA